MKRDEKVSTYWPIVLALVSAIYAYGALNQRVSANEDNIKTLKTDHDTLVEVRQVVCGLASYLQSPMRCQ